MSRFAHISQAAAVVNTYILDTKMVAIWAKLKKKKQREGRIVDEDTTTQTSSSGRRHNNTDRQKNIEWWNEWFKSPLYVKFI